MEPHRKIHRFEFPEKLEGTKALLIPLGEPHTDELYETAKDENIWTHYTFRQMRNKARFKEFIKHSLDEMAAGTEFTFTIIDKEANKKIGGSSFLDISHENRSLEIGRTWISPRLQGTGFNAEVKYLMLEYCFEILGLARVFFKTDSNNKRSLAALKKIGAVYEGTFRNHMIREDGSYRHSAFFGIIDTEWPGIKSHIKNLISAVK